MNKKLEKILKNTFVLGSIRDSAIFLDMCLKNAFYSILCIKISINMVIYSEK